MAGEERIGQVIYTKTQNLLGTHELKLEDVSWSSTTTSPTLTSSIASVKAQLRREPIKDSRSKGESCQRQSLGGSSEVLWKIKVYLDDLWMDRWVFCACSFLNTLFSHQVFWMESLVRCTCAGYEGPRSQVWVVIGSHLVVLSYLVLYSQSEPNSWEQLLGRIIC
jgi:hypothetical protein